MLHQRTDLDTCPIYCPCLLPNTLENSRGSNSAWARLVRCLLCVRLLVNRYYCWIRVVFCSMNRRPSNRHTKRNNIQRWRIDLSIDKREHLSTQVIFVIIVADLFRITQQFSVVSPVAGYGTLTHVFLVFLVAFEWDRIDRDIDTKIIHILSGNSP